MSRRSYPRYFYSDQSATTPGSAQRIVASILENIQPKSVVDVGCGVGHFLAAFTDHAIDDIRGIDLPGIDMETLQFPAEHFVSWDLTTPYRTDRQFDLVLSLETAEHLPSTSADVFVDTLTGLGSIIIFSAAVPFQGGFRHLNEQWQDYWASRFNDRGYVPVDCLRDRLWQDEGVSGYYRQNILMYVKEPILGEIPSLLEAWQRTDLNSLSRIHPLIFQDRVDPHQVTLRFLLKALPAIPRAIARATRIRLNRVLSR